MSILDHRRKPPPQYLGLLKLLIYDQSKNIYLIFKFKTGVKVVHMPTLYMTMFGRIHTKVLTATLGLGSEISGD